MKAVRVHEYGGPDALRYEDVPTPIPGAGEVLVKVEASGVNYIDIYHRTGLYPGKLPLTLGTEAAGVVAMVGDGVTDFRVNDRVAYTGVQGSYAEYAIVPAGRLVSVPTELKLADAAAVMLQGMTAHYLTHSTYPIHAGDRVLVHAAAGGAGLLIVQMAKRRGAQVFGTVSTEEKAALARSAGADEVILYTQEDFEQAVKQHTNGKGVHVVYDSVGRDTFDKSLNCLAMRGTMVLFGQSSGPVPPFDPLVLNAKGSLFLTRPTLFHYIAERADLLDRASAVLDMVLSGEVKLRIEQTFPLGEAAEAHRQLESRKTTGKLLLIP